MKRPILLLGADGQVGWQLRRDLAPLGSLVALNRGQCDLADTDALRACVRHHAPGIVVNAAAYTAVDKAETDEAAAQVINGVAPGVLAEEARSLGALLVHYSTDYVFDGAKEAAYVEDDPTNPLSAYGRSKLAGEEAIRAVDGRALIFRTSWVFGPRGGNFVKTILRLAKERESLKVVSDQVGSPTPAELISSVTAQALANVEREPALAEGARIYHLAAAEPLSWHGFARAIVEAAAAQGMALALKPETIGAIPTSGYPLPARRPANSRLDCALLEQTFGLQMPSWRPYLDRLLQTLSLGNP